MDYYLMDLKGLLGDKIEEVVRRGDLSSSELECMDKAVDIIKDIETIEAMRNYGEDEYSSRATRRYYDGDGRRMGQSRQMYSRNGGDMVHKLEALMSEAHTDEERRTISEMIDRLNRQ